MFIGYSFGSITLAIDFSWFTFSTLLNLPKFIENNNSTTCNCGFTRIWMFVIITGEPHADSTEQPDQSREGE